MLRHYEAAPSPRWADKSAARLSGVCGEHALARELRSFPALIALEISDKLAEQRPIENASPSWSSPQLAAATTHQMYREVALSLNVGVLSHVSWHRVVIAPKPRNCL